MYKNKKSNGKFLRICYQMEMKFRSELEENYEKNLHYLY